MTTPKETATPRTLEEIYQDALRLSLEERENLIAMLNQDYPQVAAAAKIDKAWAEELRRRVDLLRAGQMATVSAGEAIQRAHARLAAGRK